MTLLSFIFSFVSFPLVFFVAIDQILFSAKTFKHKMIQLLKSKSKTFMGKNQKIAYSFP